MATKKAAKKQAPKQTFGVTGELKNLSVSLDITAANMEEALVKAKELKWHHFIQAKGDVFDYEGPTIISIWKN